MKLHLPCTLRNALLALLATGIFQTASAASLTLPGYSTGTVQTSETWNSIENAITKASTMDYGYYIGASGYAIGANWGTPEITVDGMTYKEGDWMNDTLTLAGRNGTGGLVATFVFGSDIAAGSTLSDITFQASGYESNPLDGDISLGLALRDASGNAIAGIEDAAAVSFNSKTGDATISLDSSVVWEEGYKLIAVVKGFAGTATTAYVVDGIAATASYASSSSGLPTYTATFADNKGNTLTSQRSHIIFGDATAGTPLTLSSWMVEFSVTKFSDAGGLVYIAPSDAGSGDGFGLRTNGRDGVGIMFANGTSYYGNEASDKIFVDAASVSAENPLTLRFAYDAETNTVYLYDVTNDAIISCVITDDIILSSVAADHNGDDINGKTQFYTQNTALNFSLGDITDMSTLAGNASDFETYIKTLTLPSSTPSAYYWESGNSAWSGSKWAATDGGSTLVSLPTNTDDTTVNVVFNNNETAEITIDGSVSVDNMSIEAGDYSFVGTGDDSLAVDGELSVAGGATATLEGLDVSAGSITVESNGTLNLTDVTLSTTISNSGTVELSGTINLDNISGTTQESISGTTNGYSTVTTSYKVVDGGSSGGTGVTAWKINGEAASGNFTGGTFTVTSNGTTYYAGSSTETAVYNAGDAHEAMVLNGGTIQLNATPTGNGFFRASSAGGTLDLNGQSLNQNALGTLEGATKLAGSDSSVYTISSGYTLKENLALANDWKGTVIVGNISASTRQLDISSLSNAGSKVSMGNVAVQTLTSQAGSISCESLAIGSGTSSINGSLTLQNSALTLNSADAKLEAGKLVTTAGALTLRITDSTVLDTLNHASASAPVVLITLDEAYSGGATLQVLSRAATGNKYTSQLMWENGGKQLVYATTVNQNFVSDSVEVETTNGAAGVQMIQQAFQETDPQASAAGSELAGILDAVEQHLLDDKGAAAVAGASVATLGVALSSDMERQLKAIRNRTTTMGVGGDDVVHTGMPYCNAWINAEGNYTKMSKDDAAAGYTLNNWGGTVGLDIDVDPYFTMGFAFTAMYGDYKTEGPDTIKGDMDTCYVTAFARYTSSAWTHTFVASYGLMDSKFDRSVSAGALSYETEGKTEGSSLGLLYELGYVVALDEEATTCLQPVVNVMFRHTSIDAYSEKGGNAALDIDEQSMNTVTFGFGTRLQAVVGENLYNRTSILEARVLGKAHTGDRHGEADVAFAGTSARAKVESASMGTLGVEAGIGLIIPVGSDGGSVFADASGEYNNGYFNANATLGYRINF